MLMDTELCSPGSKLKRSFILKKKKQYSITSCLSTDVGTSTLLLFFKV